MRLSHDLYKPEPGAGAQGAPLLIAHGLLGSRRNWATLARKFAAGGAAGRTVASVDLRNHGDSPRAESMSYQEMGADLLETAEALFGRPAILLGHSMGGKAAMAAALSAPERIAGLIAVDIAPVAYDHPEHAQIVSTLRAVDLSAVAKRSDVDPQIAAAIPEASLRAFLLANLAFEGGSEGGRRARWRADLEAIAANIDLITGWPETLATARYDGPAFWLHGGASPYVAEAARAAIRDRFADAAIEEMPGAGHWLHAERPDDFLASALAWLDKR